MLVANTYTKSTVLYPGSELTLRHLRGFRAEIGLALSAADSVAVDLRSTKRINSWVLIAIVDLAIAFSPRLTFVAPDYLREALLRIEPRAEVVAALPAVRYLGTASR